MVADKHDSTSIAFEVILHLILREISEHALKKSTPIRILDVGCGNGKLISFLQSRLSEVLDAHKVDIHGCDIEEENVQKFGYLEKTRESLARSFPDINWAQRIITIPERGYWPLTQKFDIIISNVVLEHVRDKEWFFRNISMNLTATGASIHIFPTSHIIVEPHLKIPFVHKIANLKIRSRWIKIMGNRNYRENPGKYADYVQHYTYYSSEAEIHRLCKDYNLSSDFTDSPLLYFFKANQILRRNTFPSQSDSLNLFVMWLLHKVLRYGSSVTVRCTKKNNYRALTER